MTDFVEFKQLRCFVAVAEELNFTRAAKRISVSQPILSRIVKQLEEDIGVPLLVRNRRRVVLTPAGESFLLESRKTLAQLQEAIDVVLPLHTQGLTKIRVGFGAALAERFTPVVMDYEERFPRVQMEIYDIGSSLQNEALCNRSIDVGFLRPPIDLQNLSSEFLFKENIMVLLPKKHPLAKRKTVRVVDLSKEPLLLHERHQSVGMYDKILQIFRDGGVEPRVVETKTGPYEDAGMMLVARGKGIFLVSGSQSLRILNDCVTTVRLDEPNAYFDVHMAWRTEETSRGILHFLDAVLQKLSPPRRR